MDVSTPDGHNHTLLHETWMEHRLMYPEMLISRMPLVRGGVEQVLQVLLLVLMTNRYYLKTTTKLLFLPS